MKSDARMTAVKESAEPPKNSHKIDEDPQAAWQLFNANWLIIAVMGSLLALGLTSTNLRLEPIAFGTTLAIAAALLAVSYHHRLTRGDRTDPKLFFSLGTIGQVILTCAIVGPLSYVAGAIGILSRIRRCFLWIAHLVWIPSPSFGTSTTTHGLRSSCRAHMG